MQFTYDDQPTIQAAIRQGIGPFTPKFPTASVIDAAVDDRGAEVATEVRNLLTSKLTLLLDVKGVATEWNDAIERAMRIIEEA